MHRLAVTLRVFLLWLALALMTSAFGQEQAPVSAQSKKSAQKMADLREKLRRLRRDLAELRHNIQQINEIKRKSKRVRPGRSIASESPSPKKSR